MFEYLVDGVAVAVLSFTVVYAIQKKVIRRSKDCMVVLRSSIAGVT